MADAWYDIRKLKVTQRAALGLQIVLLVFLFLPVARVTDSSQLMNSVELGVFYLHHGGILSHIGGVVYCAFSFALPVSIWLVTLLLRSKNRLNYAVSVALCALESISSACFYTMVQHRMNATVALNPLSQIILILEIVNMFVYIHAYLQSWQGTN
ncbi:MULTISPECIES: hypothetical protein [Caproicibacterium]|uniref:Uncharacterized protein n=1 Tax=Caproicibacterium argilliputei TaxID=3030016 RepID=A0AA97H156_9FIRM|nr:hypothetical protein [Caproicibacterium argilliputei]WOC32296.1 hypothetical protein PXC00_00075 [Caproicibacterium argilliputei]